MTTSDNTSNKPTSIYSFSDEVVLKPENLDEYRKIMSFFHHLLYRLEKSLFIVDCIESFPFDLFTIDEDRIFLSQVVTIFLDDALITVHKLVIDNTYSYTLQELKNKISPRDRRKLGFIKDEFKELFDEAVNSLYFEEKTKQIRMDVDTLRNERVAHNTRDWVLGKSTVEALEFRKFRELVSATKSLFDALSFNSHRALLPFSYTSSATRPSISDTRPDIEKILDSIARESFLLNLPEHEVYPGIWSQQKQQLSPDKIAQFNYYRKKFGLPEV